MKKNLIAAAMLTLAFAASSHAQTYNLLVDDSNPSAVTITATGNFATLNDSTIASDAGVDLLQFFTSPVTFNIGPVYNGQTLSANMQSAPYNAYSNDNASGTNVDMNLYDGAVDGIPQDFSTAAAAFNGTMTIDLSSVAAELPAAGTVGDILDGYNGAAGGGASFSGNVGTYEVVPEPSAIACFGLGAIGMMTVRRRQKTA